MGSITSSFDIVCQGIISQVVINGLSKYWINHNIDYLK